MQKNEFVTGEHTIVNECLVNTDPRENAVHGYPAYPNWQPQRRKHKAWRALIICASALLAAWTLFILTGGLSFSSVQKTLPTRSFILHGHGALVVNEASGTLHVHTGNSNQVIVRGNERAYGPVSSINNLQVFYAQSGNTVTVRTNENWLLVGDGELNLDITVPASIDVTIHNSSADAVVENVSGQINATTSSGNLHLIHSHGSLNLSTSSGDIILTDEQGSVSAQTSSGNITAGRLSGRVDLSTSSGNITLEQTHLAGQDRLQTSSGDISFGGSLDLRGNYQMKTSSGSITLSLPATSSFQLTIATNSGSVHNDFAASPVTSIPYARIELETSSGDMYVRRQ